MKTEPSTFSIEDLKKRPKQTDRWEGVRNYQVRNMIRDDMAINDQALLYHSSCKTPGVAGIVKICSEAYTDVTALDPESRYYDPKSTEQNPRWFLVDVQLVTVFPALITLQALKAHPDLSNMLILRRGNRLSITPVTASEWQTILDMV